jgi:hypothetical protein
VLDSFVCDAFSQLRTAAGRAPADDVFEGGITFSFNVVMVAAIWQT